MKLRSEISGKSLSNIAPPAYESSKEGLVFKLSFVVILTFRYPSRDVVLTRKEELISLIESM